MPPANFPTGITSYGMPVLPGGIMIPPTTGSVFFVSSGTGNDNNLGTDPGQPLATIAKAITLCTANKGDIILVMPGHAESISGAGAITISKAGISIIGLGNGTNRPLITLHTTVTTIAISAANVTLRNLVITADVTALVACFNITGAFCVLDKVDYAETAACSTLNFITCTAADLQTINCSWVNSQTQSASVQQWVLLNAAHRVKILNCFASLNGVAAAANGVVVGVTAASSDVDIAFNRFMSVGSVAAVGINLLTATTGLVRENHVATAKTAIAGNIALASCYGMNNYSSHVVNKNGLLDPVVDA